MLYDAIIIGGGAAGMSAAIAASAKVKRKCRDREPRILLLEKNKKLGKKLYATGNGRCNLANKYLDLSCYDSQNEFFPYQIISATSYKEVLTFIKNLGVEVCNLEGYFYPLSLQASTLVWALTDKLKSENVEFHLNETVIDIKFENQKYKLYTTKGEYCCKNAILACGGAAAPRLGGSLSGYHLAESLGHKVISPLPALCKLKTSSSIALLKGARVKAEAALYVDYNEYARETGEIQFTEDGLSGILFFNLSILAGRLLEKKEEPYVLVGLIPEKTETGILIYMRNFADNHPKRTIMACLNGLLNEKAARYILDTMKITNTAIKDFTEEDFAKIAHVIKNLRFPIIGTGSFEEAQVSAGGIDTKQMNPSNCSSKLLPNLYITGELLDVTGKCGGYNLMWAITTGTKAGNGIHI